MMRLAELGHCGLQVDRGRDEANATSRGLTQSAGGHPQRLLGHTIQLKRERTDKREREPNFHEPF
eukprot:1769881-Amphidinium_carterae.1